MIVSNLEGSPDVSKIHMIPHSPVVRHDPLHVYENFIEGICEMISES